MTMQTQMIRRGPAESMDLPALGQMFAKSGFFQDSRDAAQACVKIQAGAELGFPPVQSMMGINIIKGRVALSANLMAAAIKRSGRYTYTVAKLDETACEIEFFEQGKSIGWSKFSLADAKKAGTQNMDKFPRNMLFARAISNGAKWYTPDVFGGPVYTPDELGAEVDEDGNATPPPAPQGKPPLPAPQPPPQDTQPEADAVDLNDDGQFVLAVAAAYEARGIDVALGDQITAMRLDKGGLSNLTDVPDNMRRGFIKKINEGEFDSYKQPAETAAA